MSLLTEFPGIIGGEADDKPADKFYAEERKEKEEEIELELQEEQEVDEVDETDEEATEDKAAILEEPDFEVKSEKIYKLEKEIVAISYEKALALARNFHLGEDNLQKREEEKIVFQKETENNKVKKLQIKPKEGKIHYLYSENNNLGNENNKKNLTEDELIRKSKELYNSYDLNEFYHYKFELTDKKEELNYLKAYPLVNSSPVVDHPSKIILNNEKELMELKHTVKKYTPIKDTAKEKNAKEIIYKETSDNIIEPFRKINDSLTPIID